MIKKLIWGAVIAGALGIAAAPVASAQPDSALGGTGEQAQGIRSNDRVQGALEGFNAQLHDSLTAFQTSVPQAIRDNDAWQSWRGPLNDRIRVIFGNGR